jgi:hypothetical protein
MNILLIHRQEENQDFINYACNTFAKLGQVSSMREDQSVYMTSDRSTWLRDCAIGYSIYGQPRYDVYIVIGRFLDTVSQELIGMIQSKPIYYASNGSIKKLDKSSIEDMEIK